MTRVFVIDDEPDMVDLLATILRSDGFEVETDTDLGTWISAALDTDGNIGALRAAARP